jgi:hypothetical protein
MRKALLWLGVLFCAIGVGVVGVSAVLAQRGGSPSLNLGDPAKFQFILVPFWQIGLGLAVLGALAILVSRLVRARAPAARS